MKIIIALLLSVSFLSCNKTENHSSPKIQYHSFESFSDFIKTLTFITSIKEETKRQSSIDTFFDSLKSHHQNPFILNDSVAFLYTGAGSSISWAGDFNGWSPSTGTELNNSSLWILEKNFPNDARLDYKIVRDGNWILDPNNDFVQPILGGIEARPFNSLASTLLLSIAKS